MSAPHVLTTTIGSLPAFSITKDLAEKAAPRSRLAPVITKTAPKASASSPSARGKRLPVLSLCLVAGNVILAACYFYNVNNAQALEFAAKSSQRTLSQLQDKQRQYQVHIAEASASIRAQESTIVGSGFVPFGTPEFVSAGGPAVLTMR
jgi:hypothetical protein